jgi:hypothetical protein
VHFFYLSALRYVYKFWVRKPEGKEPLGTLRHRWADNSKMDHIEKECEDVHWIHLAQDRIQWQALVNTVMILQVLYKGIG